MKPAAASKSVAEPTASDRTSAAQKAALDALRRENAALRREIAALESYRTLAYRDALTGLWNRRYFDERFAEELSRSRRSPRDGFSVLMVDVNDLKRVNDQQGHQAGDAAIAWVAGFLRATMRSHDVCCRTGGDEFAVILPDVPGRDCASIVQRLRNKLAAANEGRERPIGLSFGCASCPDDGAAMADLLRAADEAMYRDKRRQKATRNLAEGPVPSLADRRSRPLVAVANEEAAPGRRSSESPTRRIGIRR